MIPKFHSKLTPWTGGHLSPAGRQVGHPIYRLCHPTLLDIAPKLPSMMVSKMRSITSRFLWQGSYLSLMLHLWSMMFPTDPDGMYLSWLYFGRQTLCNAYVIFRWEERISAAGERNPIYTWGRPPMLSVQTSKGYRKPFIWPLRIHSQSLGRFASIHNKPYHSWDIQPWIGRLMVYMEGTQSLYISASSSASSSYLYENHSYALWVELNLKYFPDNVLYRYLDGVVTAATTRWV